MTGAHKKSIQLNKGFLPVIIGY